MALECVIFVTTSIVREIGYHRTIRVDGRSPGEQVVCDLLRGYPDVDVAEHLHLVDGAILLIPLVEFHPRLLRDVVDTTYNWKAYINVYQS